MTPYSTPSDLVLALKRRDPPARRHLTERYLEKLVRLIGRLGERLSASDSRARLSEYALHALEMWLFSQRAGAFSDDTWKSFDARVLLYLWRILSVPRQDHQSPSTVAAPAATEIQSGPFAVRSFIRQLDGVGGDSWMHDASDSDSLLILVTDVTGHGLPAHLLASGLPDLWRMCLARYPAADRRPGMLIAELDRELLGVLPEGVFVEATLAQFVGSAPATARLCVAGNSAVIVRSVTARMMKLGGMYLGLISGVTRTDTELDFGPDDELIAATDGLWEQPTDEAGNLRVSDSVAEFLKNLKPTDNLHNAVISFLENAIQQSGEQHDDLCVVTVRNSGVAGPTMSDADLVARICRQSDGLARNEMVERFRRLIWALTTRILRHSQKDWDDAYQEVWLRVWHKLGDWRGGQLKTWIGRIAVNRLIDYSKRIRAEANTSEELSGDVPEKVTSAVDENDQSGCLRCLQEALANRTEKERRLIQMVSEGIPHGQIREALGIKQRSFYNLLTEIREDVKSRCQEHCSHGD